MALTAVASGATEEHKCQPFLSLVCLYTHSAKPNEPQLMCGKRARFVSFAKLQRITKSEQS